MGLCSPGDIGGCSPGDTGGASPGAHGVCALLVSMVGVHLVTWMGVHLVTRMFTWCPWSLCQPGFTGASAHLVPMGFVLIYTSGVGAHLVPMGLKDGDAGDDGHSVAEGDMYRYSEDEDSEGEDKSDGELVVLTD
ncbi:hypothetical protein IHE44_0008452 [Lamprotornis superbus]|uniref:Uncharacterized protein n=1 Tax=Lamprotornis superbus TaxID=245042 RepID=A0A835TRA2_9PASS|nr:hypothetical protein IHE44_0008452 [Lamprotornis superbus]